MRRATVPSSADTAALMPAGMGARMDRVQAAVAALRAEERRLERLGLEEAEARCREQRRYWEFLAAVFEVADPDRPGAGTPPRAWPGSDPDAPGSGAW